MRRHLRRAFLVSLALLVTGLAVMPSEALAGGRHGRSWHGGSWHGGSRHGGSWHGGSWRGPRAFVGLGVPFVVAPFAYGAYRYPYYPYPAYGSPPVIVESAPSQVYIERDYPPQPAPAQQYWHYCESARAYYPYVKECPGGWLQVVPQAPR
jgi:hypothetical protein